MFMNIIIVGGGKVGTKLTELLAGEGHDVTVIDTAPKLIENIVNNQDVIGYCGNGASFPIQNEAGVAKCDVFISVTGSDELNIMSCLVAEKIGAKHSVARVRNPEYSLQMDFLRDKLGIDLVVNPDFESANEISRMIEYPAASKVETFAKGRVELAEITVAEGSVLDGLHLYDLKKNISAPMLICAVQRGEEVIIPSGNFVINAGDIIHFSTSKYSISKVFKELGFEKKKIKSVLIIGGSRTSYYLAKHLAKVGIKVCLVENDASRAAELEANLSGVTVICGDGTDTEFLEEYHLEHVDATVALTDIDEENMIFSMYADQNNVKKTICKVTRPALIKMLPTIAKNCSIVYPQELTASIILRYVRAVGNSEEASSVQTLYRILDGKAEAAEFFASDNSAVVGVSLKELKLKPNVLIACVSKKGSVIIPDGSTVIEPNDSVIVITAGQKISDLSEILL